jgi:hypothetical protein
MNKEKRMYDIAEAYHKSEMGPKQFATTKGLSLNQLKYWIKKLKKQKPSSSSFIQINPSPTSPAKDLLEINYPNGVKIKVATTDFSFLSQLIRVY